MSMEWMPDFNAMIPMRWFLICCVVIGVLCFCLGRLSNDP